MGEVDEISMLEFVEKRAKEMKMMLELSQVVSGNDAPQQKLPRHMRRRAANHNIKRLPRAIRHKVPKESLAIQKKRPSRKHRRRPSNLMKEYEKRSSKKRWLETHIWHAKRFHMCDLWGCKIARHRNDRGVRAAYRDSRHECVIIDISWMHCFELIGSETDIIKALEPFVCSLDDGLSILSNQRIGGQFEGDTVFYKKSNGQNIPIANVKFLWKFNLIPCNKRSLLIWVHPSSGNELLDHFKQVLKLAPSEDNDQVLTNNIIEILVRTKDFCRFKLIGPKSQSVLFTALKFSNMESKQFLDFYSYNNDELCCTKAQQNNWCSLKTSNAVAFPSHVVHGLLVEDPRLNMPKKKLNSGTSGIFSNYNHSSIHQFEPRLSYSSIWNKDLMLKLQEIKLSTHSMNELRSGSLLSTYNPSIPILLVQNPGCTNNAGDPGHGSGWDIIIPRGWGMAFWLGFIYRGARSIGLEELKHLDYETAYPTFPEFYPDSKSGREFHLSVYQQLSSKYERMPRSKRPNYTKLKVQTPFHCPWQELCEEWNNKFQLSLNGGEDAYSFFVIRDNKFLRELDKSIGVTAHTEIGRPKIPAGEIIRKVTIKGSSKCYLSVEMNGHKKIIFDKSLSLQPSIYVNQMMEAYSMGLVTVAMEILKRGNPKFCMICIPTLEDIVAYNDEKKDIFEPPGSTSRRSKYDTANIQKATNVVDFCSRQIIGFSVAGGFSFFRGKGRAVGFASLLGLKKLYSSNSDHLKVVTRPTSRIHPNLVLVRSTTSLHYEFATIKTISDIPQ